MDTICLVAPLSEELERIYDAIIAPCIEEFGVKCLRVNDMPGTALSNELIRSAFTHRLFIVGEFTGDNAGALYALGLRNASERKALLLHSAGVTLPPGLRPLRTLQYTRGQEESDTLQRSLEVAIEAIVGPMDRGRALDGTGWVRSYPERDTSTIKDLVARAEDYVKILDTTLDSFVGAADQICQVAANGRSVRLLTLDPLCPSCEERDIALRYDGKFPAVVTSGIDIMKREMLRRLESADGLIRKHHGNTGCAAVITESEVLATWFLRERRSREAVHVEATRGESKLWDHISEHFDKVWRTACELEVAHGGEHCRVPRFPPDSGPTSPHAGRASADGPAGH